MLKGYLLAAQGDKRYYANSSANACGKEITNPSLARRLQQYRKLAKQLLRSARVWVYSPNTQSFGPSKFVGFQNMSFGDYEAARQAARQGAYIDDDFDGRRTDEAIRKTLKKSWAKSPQLSEELKRWGRSLLEPDVFKDINETKWRFFTLQDE